MSFLNVDSVSIVHWFNDIEKHRCGYCKGENCSISNGMWAETMTVEDYQNLIDRGWRRSGKYCYKPIMDETCCPQYTIRCDAVNFSPSKSQKKNIKKFNKFLCDGILAKRESDNADQQTNDSCYSEVFIREKPQFDMSKLRGTNIECIDNIENAISEHNHVNNEHASSSSQQNTSVALEVKIAKQASLTKSVFKAGHGADPSKPPCKKAKLLRLEKRQQKMLQRGMSLEKLKTDNESKSLENFFNEIDENAKHKLIIKIVPTSEPGILWESVKDAEFDLYKKYQMQIHNDPPEKCTMHGFTKFLVTSPLKIRLVRLDRKHVTYKFCAKLYAKYQVSVHNESLDECNEEQFYDFLVDTPLQPTRFENDEEPGYGSFHQQYWLDDKLIAVGVIDILPRCISSVYFFYDPDYRNLTLGTYGSLRELQFTKSLHAKMPDIKHYYMGFYIHSCPKMRYKGRLSLSYLLCPETFVWISIEKCIAKLEASKYARLNDDLDALDLNLCDPCDIDGIKVLIGYKFTTFSNYKYKNRFRDVFNTIGKLIGKLCAKSLLFVVR